MDKAPPSLWSNTTKEKFTGAFDILAAMERAGATLPTSTEQRLHGLLGDTFDCAEQVLADPDIWRSMPDRLDMGRVFPKDEVKQRLANLVASAR